MTFLRVFIADSNESFIPNDENGKDTWLFFNGKDSFEKQKLTGNMKLSQLIVSIIINAFFFLIGFVAKAQLKIDHLPGDAGLQSGTQAPPSIIAFVPIYNFHSSTFKNKEGNSYSGADINAFFTGIGGSIVTNLKLLYANWGVSVMVPFSSNRIEGGLVSSKSSLAFTDIYIQPVQLGWKTKKADFIFGYALYLSTGKYAAGGDDNTGLGMLTNEFSAGSTVYFDEEKQWHFAALFSYAINSAKKIRKTMILPQAMY